MANKRNIFLPLSIISLWSFSLCQDSPKRADALLEAVWTGDFRQVRTLIAKGEDVNYRGAFRYTPLILAAKYGRLEIAIFLCDKGADVNAVSSADAKAYGEFGFTPLLWAVSNCDTKMAELLVNKGADVGRPGEEGDTPLIIAVRKNCLGLLKWLIEKGAVVSEASQYDGTTPLSAAVKTRNLDAVDYLVSKGAILGTKDFGGARNLLSMAAANGFLGGVRYFIEKGLPVNERDDIGLTAIHYALRPTIVSRYILEFLVEHGGDPKIRSNIGTSPLMQACLHGLPWQAGFLIDKGATVNDEDLNRETPLHYACRGIPQGTQRALSGERGSGATIKLLLDKGAYVNVIDLEGKTPLIDAARNDSPYEVELLLNHGARINAQDHSGRTALMYAAECNQTAVIKVLAHRGADLNLRDIRGQTALSLASQKLSSAQAYELLTSLGAKRD